MDSWTNYIEDNKVQLITYLRDGLATNDMARAIFEQEQLGEVSKEDIDKLERMITHALKRWEMLPLVSIEKEKLEHLGNVMCCNKPMKVTFNQEDALEYWINYKCETCGSTVSIDAKFLGKEVKSNDKK
jgi:hypothetical protein